MVSENTQMGDAQRLEALWAGEFGDSYTDRNLDSYAARGVFWQRLLETYPVERVLEVGCNAGGNLEHLRGIPDPPACVGIDINARALAELRNRVPGAIAVLSPARSLPFASATFDLVMSIGVLIHQPDESVGAVMSEVVRCSRQYVFCAEYEADVVTSVQYRDAPRSLFKRPYAKMFIDRFSRLRPLARGNLARSDGFDDVDWTLFRKD